MFLAASEYINICKKIENDPNFRLDTRDEDVNLELLNRVRDKNGLPLESYQTMALAIQLSPLNFILNYQGRLYQIKIAKYGDIDSDEVPIWHIDTSKILVVDSIGHATVHWRRNVAQGDLNKPIEGLNLDQYLGNENPPLPRDIPQVKSSKC